MEAEPKIQTAAEADWSVARERKRGRLSLMFESQGVWAIADQGIVSLGNFLTTILLARSLTPQAYGIWSIVFGFIIFLNVIHSSLIVYPLSVVVATRDDEKTGREISSALALTVTLAIPQALGLAATAWIIGQAWIGMCAGLALVLWQVQETTRRALMARLRFQTALLTDAVSYLGQAGLIWMLVRREALSSERSFIVIALTCGVAALLQALMLGMRTVSVSGCREMVGRFWELGHWVLWSNLASNFTLQAVPLALFLVRGAGDVAGFQAISNLMGVSHPIMLSLGNIIVPAAARERVRSGLRAARHVAFLHSSQGALLLLPYFAALLLFPTQLLKMFYGLHSPYSQLQAPLRLFAIAYVIFYATLALKFLLNALEQNRAQFKAELISSLILALAIVPMVMTYGLTGAVAATGIWFAVRLVCNAVAMRQVNWQLPFSDDRKSKSSVESRGIYSGLGTIKVLLSGHACSPEHGSEPAVTWNFAWHLSRRHEVWVITEPNYRGHIERHLQSHPNPNLNFVWVSLNPLWSILRTSGSETGLRLYYIFWQRAVLRVARRLHRIHTFDVAQHVSWGTVSAPPLLWRLPIPFIWGPVGGGQTAPAAFRRYFGRGQYKEKLRTLRVSAVPGMPSLRKAVRESALLLSTNPDTTRVLAAAGATSILPFLSAGVSEEIISAPFIKRTVTKGELKIIWAGRLIPLKALSLALEALAQVEPKLGVHLQVLGDGPLRSEMEELSRKLGIADRVEFLGNVPWCEMPDYYRRADLFLFTALRDSAPTVILEAMAHGLPILTLDHQGVGAMVPAEAGIKVPVTMPEATVEALARGIRRFALEPALLQSMGEAGWISAQSMGWERRAMQMSTWYQEVVEQHQASETGRAYAAL